MSLEYQHVIYVINTTGVFGKQQTIDVSSTTGVFREAADYIRE